VRQHIFRAAAPNQLLGFRVIDIDNQGSFFVILLCGCSFAQPTESSPAPPSAEAVVEGLECSLGFGRLDGNDGEIAIAIYGSQSLEHQLLVHSILDSRVPQRVW